MRLKKNLRYNAYVMDQASTVNENSKAQDSIFQKDKEYSTFIENFDEIKKQVRTPSFQNTYFTYSCSVI